jgi:hypothetical protein
MDCRLWTVDCELWTVGCGLWVSGERTVFFLFR